MDKQAHNELVKEFADCQRQSTDEKLSISSREMAKRRMVEICDIFNKEYSESEEPDQLEGTI